MILFYLLIVVPAISSLYVVPSVVVYFGQAVGWYLRRKSRDRRTQLFSRVQAEEEDLRKGEREVASVEEDGWETVESHVPGSAVNGGRAPKEWAGVVGFFHPFCNAGGGGERVLWAAIRATQKRWPRAICVVYTGDHDVDKIAILERVEQRFNIQLHPPTVMFLYLSTRHYILSSTYPHMTLLGQSLGSLIVAYDAFSLLVPDIFIDTMGFAFILAFSKFLFPSTPTGAYVHYPTISTDMLGSLSDGGQGLNAGTGRGWKGKAKKRYWHLFARIYGWVGAGVDIVMTNSSWTQAHIRSLWGPARAKHLKFSDVQVVFPPVAVEELEREIDAGAESERKRERVILYIAQFRPEKNHTLILKSFAEFLSQQSPHDPPVRLALIGSVRNSEDATRVYDLRLLAHELRVKESVSFICDASWPEILNWLRKSWVGVNGMWNEHFGIGVVEYQAAGLISVVHDSGGPKEDIVIEFDGGPTGFHATTAAEFATAFKTVFALSTSETLTMRRRARASAKRFTEEAFATRWISQMERLVELENPNSGVRS